MVQAHVHADGSTSKAETQPWGSWLHHVYFEMLTLDVLLLQQAFLRGPRTVPLVEADKVEVVQFILVNGAPPGQLMVGGHQQHHLVLSIGDSLHSGHPAVSHVHSIASKDAAGSPRSDLAALGTARSVVTTNQCSMWQPTKGQLMQKGVLPPGYACCKRRHPQRSDRLAHRSTLPSTKLVLH